MCANSAAGCRAYAPGETARCLQKGRPDPLCENDGPAQTSKEFTIPNNHREDDRGAFGAVRGAAGESGWPRVFQQASGIAKGAVAASTEFVLFPPDPFTTQGAR